MSQTPNIDFRTRVEMLRERMRRITMCKKGQISTEINKRIKEDLGDKPQYDSKEKVHVLLQNVKEIQKILRFSAAEIKSCVDEEDYLSEERMSDINYYKREEAMRFERKILEHPLAKPWDDAAAKYREEERARCASLDSDVQRLIDDFSLGVIDLADLPDAVDELEGTPY